MANIFVAIIWLAGVAYFFWYQWRKDHDYD